MSPRELRDRRGDPVVLGEELGAGGEGSVFAIPARPALCAKIYRADKAPLRAEKIHAMLAHRPPWLLRRSIAWPVEALYASQDRASFTGFVMPAQRGMIELFQLIVPDERMAIAGFLTQKDLAIIASRLARLVAGVHRAGHCIGDLKPQNILVSPVERRVALIDTDSFQIRDPNTDTTHRSMVVTPEYTAPELCGVDPSRVDRTAASDAFGLAVIVHQILLGGAHPFDGDLVASKGSIERVPGRIRRGLCPLVPGVTEVRPAAGAIPFGTLHEDLQTLFVRAFGPGHSAPRERPSAADWERALDRAAGAMIHCRTSPSHLHDRALESCPWCDRRARTGIDLFASGQRWQRALTRAGGPLSAPEIDRIHWLRQHVRGRVTSGSLSAAERAWLEKAGASLGFDRARITRTIAEESAPVAAPPKARVRLADLVAKLRARAPSAPLLRLRVPRRRLVISAVSMAASGAALTAAFAASKPAARALDDSTPREMCAVAAETATIGNTRGKGAFLRASPSVVSERLGLPEGTVVRLTGRTRTAEDLVWSEVEVPSLARAGWVATRYLNAKR